MTTASKSNNMPSQLSQDSEVTEGGVSERQGLLETLVYSLSNRGLWTHSIKMLNETLLLGHPWSLLERLTWLTIGTISETVVYNNEHVREEGLNILANLHVKVPSKSVQQVLKLSLVWSVNFGLTSGDHHQILNTIKFIRTIWESMYTLLGLVNCELTCTLVRSRSSPALPSH